MEKPPIHEIIENAAAQKKLLKEAKRLRRKLNEARKGIDGVIETLVKLRRNPLARPFVRGALLEQVRDLKRKLFKKEDEAAKETAHILDLKYPGLTLPKAIEHTYDLQVRRLRRPIIDRQSSLEKPRLNMLFPDLDPQIVFGGYAAAFEFLASLCHHVSIRLVTTVFPDADIDGLKAKFQNNPRISAMLADAEYVDISTAESILSVAPGDVFCAYSFWDCFLAHELAAQLSQEKFIYFCQEDETTFHDYSADHAIGRYGQALPQYTLFNTEILRSYFRANRIGIYAEGVEYGDANSVSFQHALVPVVPASMEDYQARTKGRILCYARPESHAKRNLFEMSLMALTEFTRNVPLSTEEVEFVGVGSLDYRGDIPLSNGHTLHLMPKLELDNYAKALAGFDVGLSLMYAPHPSILPFEMSCAGLVTVTNTFGTRDEAALRAISSNLVPAKPEVAALAKALATAWGRRKDYAARIEGSKLNWSRSWETTFNDSFRDQILERIHSLAGLPAAN